MVALELLSRWNVLRPRWRRPVILFALLVIRRHHRPRFVGRVGQGGYGQLGDWFGGRRGRWPRLGCELQLLLLLRLLLQALVLLMFSVRSTHDVVSRV